MPSLTSDDLKTAMDAPPAPFQEDDPNAGPLNQALQVIEKKVRNLEKRKAKLDIYRADYERGKELNDDQKAAIAKYEEVMQTLEFARELSGQFKTLALEEDKSRKRQGKKEKRERAKGEVKKIASILEVQDLLASLSDQNTKADFLSGENGAVKLTMNQLALIDEFYTLVVPSSRGEVALHSAAEHLVNLIDGKAKKVLTVTYKDLKALLGTVKNSGYFDGEAMEEEEEEPSTPEWEEETPVIPEVDKAVNGEKAKLIRDATEAVEEQQRSLMTAASAYLPSTRRQELIPHPPFGATREPLNFLQESQIDNAFPQMEQAVTEQHSASPRNVADTATIPMQTFGNKNITPPTTLSAMQYQQHCPRQMQQEEYLETKNVNASPDFIVTHKLQQPPVEQLLIQQVNQEVTTDKPHNTKNRQELAKMPQGYAAIAASKVEISDRATDTLAKISEWNVKNCDTGDSHRGVGTGFREEGCRSRGGGRGFREDRGQREDRGTYEDKGGYRRVREDRGGYRGGSRGGGERSHDTRGGYSKGREGGLGSDRRGGRGMGRRASQGNKSEGTLL